MSPLVAFLAAMTVGAVVCCLRPTVSIDILPKHDIAPTTVRIRALVRPAWGNAWLILTMDTGAEFKQQDVQLDGGMAALSYTRFWDVSTGGCVVFVAKAVTWKGLDTVAIVNGSYYGRGDAQAVCP